MAENTTPAAAKESKDKSPFSKSLKSEFAKITELSKGIKSSN